MDILSDTGGIPADSDATDQAYEKPARSKIKEKKIPVYMKGLDHWVLWKWELRRDQKGQIVLDKKTCEPQWTKPPYRPNGYKASTTNTGDWSSFDAVMDAFNAPGSTFDGIGYCFGPEDGLVGIDQDDVFISDNDGQALCEGPHGELAFEIYERFKGKGYLEFSPSMTGFHIIVKGEWLGDWNKAPGNTWLEVYDHKSPRYFTVTGDRTAGSAPEPTATQEDLDWLAEKLGKKDQATDTGGSQEDGPAKDDPTDKINSPEHDDAFLTAQIQLSANADLFTKGTLVDKTTGEIIEDHSSLDLSLCKALAFWTGRRAYQMDRLFRASALMRDKWDEMRGRETYGEMTIRKAIESAEKNGEAIYHGKQSKKDKDPSQEGVLVGGELSQQKITATLTKLMRALQDPTMSGRIIAYDEYLGANVFCYPGETTWHPLKDPDQVMLRAHLEKYFTPISKEMMRDSIMGVCNEHKVDTGVLWSETLPIWDGKDRVSGFIADYWGAEDSDYARAVGRYIWTALAGRLLAPGIKADMVPVLIGPQGIRKSTGLLAMCPNRARFLEVNLSTKSDDLARKMRARMVGELAELAGKSKKEVEELRAFITARTEEWVIKYREDMLSYPRRIFFIGTSNDNLILTDPDGLRRWLPIEVTQVDTDAIERDRDQLWAQAIVMFHAQGILWQDAQELAKNEHGDFVDELPWADRIDTWLDAECNLPGATGTWRQQPVLKMTDIMFFGLHIEIRDQNTKTKSAQGAMKRLGYGSASVYDPQVKKSVRGWVFKGQRRDEITDG